MVKRIDQKHKNSKKTRLKVSIVIVNWNGRKYLEKCLSSAYAQTYQNFEIVFVDNGSSDGSVAFVAQSFPETNIIENKENLGFAEGNNVGIRASNGEYLATLNNDTEVDQRWLEELVKAAEQDKCIGSCASKMVRYDDCSIIDSTGIRLYSTGAVEDRGGGERDNGRYDKVEEVFGACAGAALYRMKMLDDIGLFPCHYFASYEDVDLAWRAKYAGWKCLYVPQAVVYHVRFASQRRLLAEKKSFLSQKLRNQLWYQIKYLPTEYLIRNLSYLVKLYVRYIMTAIRNDPCNLKKTVTLLPSVLTERYQFHYYNELHKKEIYKWLERHQSDPE